MSDDKFAIVELNNYYYISNKLEDSKYIVFIMEKNEKNTTFTFHQNIGVKKNWFKSLINHFYNSLILFHGEINELFQINITDNSDIRTNSKEYNIICDSLNDFIESFFENLLTNKIPFLDNLLYFPLNDIIFSQIMLSTQRLYEKIPEIRFATLLYKGYIVHNEAPLDTVSILYNTLFSNIDASSKYINFNRPPYKVVQTVYTGNKDEDNKLNIPSTSSYRKGFELNNNNNFLIGLNKINVNNFNLFMPKIFIKSINEKVKLIIYHIQDLLIVLYFSESFDPQIKINTLLKMDKWSKRYFDEILPILEELYFQKNAKLDIHSYIYSNQNNRSIKISTTFFAKKNKVYALDKDKFDYILNYFKHNYLNKNSCLTKLKNNYVYFLNTLERKVLILMNDNLNMTQLKNYITEIKKEKFDYIFVL